MAANNYYDPADLRKFGKITEWSEELGTKFFDYYGKVFEDGALTAREKSLIALVGKRRSLLNYLKRKDIVRYRELIKELGIRK